MESTSKCMVCLDAVPTVNLPCGHQFCNECVRQRILYLKDAKQLRPERLTCLHEGCKQELDQQTITKTVGSQVAVILNFVVKKYRQSKDPNNVIFNCQGYLNKQRKTLVEKTKDMSRDQHSALVLPIFHEIKKAPLTPDIVECSSIMSLNRLKDSKEKCIQCYQCGATYCNKCFNLVHQGACPVVKLPELAPQPKQFEDFLKVNEISRCVNPKCGLPIDKQAGCFWVKCRCQWQMCYPCKVKWGDCQHFAKYPYKKFVPMPDWMEKALSKIG